MVEKIKDCYSCKFKSKIFMNLPYMYCKLKECPVKSVLGINCNEWEDENV